MISLVIRTSIPNSKKKRAKLYLISDSLMIKIDDWMEHT